MEHENKAVQITANHFVLPYALMAEKLGADVIPVQLAKTFEARHLLAQHKDNKQKHEHIRNNNNNNKNSYNIWDWTKTMHEQLKGKAADATNHTLVTFINYI